MRVSDVQDALRESVVVTRHDVISAKVYMVGHFVERVSDLLGALLRNQEALITTPVIWDEQGDPEPQLRRLRHYCRWTLAGYQAIWELVSEGACHPTSSGLEYLETSISYSTPRHVGSPWVFTDSPLMVPARVALAPTLTCRADEPLVDEQLYMVELHASHLEPDVSDALRDAIRCFRYEFYLPCLAVLSSATERAWIHTGLALTHFARGRSGFSPTTLDSYDTGFRSVAQSVSVTYDKVLQLYDRADVFGDIYKLSGCRPDELRQVHIWSNIVRDGRNALHYDAEPTLANSYTKTAVLLMAAADHHQTLYAIRRVAQKQVEQTSPPR